MQIVQKGLTLINNNNDFTLTEYKSQRIVRADTSYILTRRVYIADPATFFRNFDVLSQSFIYHITYLGPVRSACPLTHAPQIHHEEILRQLLTSTTVYCIDYYILAFYSRSIIWIFNRDQQVLDSYAPGVLDHTKDFQIALSSRLIVTYQKTNTFHVRSLYRRPYRAYVFRLPLNFRIMSLCVSNNDMYILACAGGHAYFGMIEIMVEQITYDNWDMYEWSDDLIICEYRLYRKNGKKYYRAQVQRADATVECAYKVAPDE